MKLFILAALVGLASASLSASELQNGFNAAKALYYGNMPMSGAESGARFAQYSKVANFVADHNAEGSNWQAAVNKFCMESDEELKQHLGLNVSEVIEEQRRSSFRRAKRSAPVIVERELAKDYTSYLPAIKDQGSCGSCWAFGATVALEYQVNKLRTPGEDTMRSLSEQQYLDCVYEDEDHDGCNGGWPATCYSWSRDNGNMIAHTHDMPYKASDGACKTDTHSAISGFSISYTQYLYSGDSYMLEAVQNENIGVISVAIGVVNSFFSYSSGVYSGESCNSINHAVDVVGYGEMNGEGYWRCRNSWGNWGDNGYINMRRGLGTENINMCSIASYAHYPVVTGADDGSNDDADGNDNNDNNDNDDNDDATDDCWVADMGEFDDNAVVGQSDYENHGLCNSMCGAYAGCVATVISPESDGSNRQCYLLNTEEVEPREGYSMAKMACYQDGDDDNGEDQDVCTYTEFKNVKLKGSISGLVYTQEECFEKCPETPKCKGCSCKNKNKCRMNKKTNTKNNSKYDGYKMDCPGRK